MQFVLGYPSVHCRPLQPVDMLFLWSADSFSGRSDTRVLLSRLTICKTGGTRMMGNLCGVSKS